MAKMVRTASISWSQRIAMKNPRIDLSTFEVIDLEF